MKKTRINNFNESLYYEKLSNGLNIYIIPIKNKKTFAAMLMINYGGRDINFKVNNTSYKTPTGIAHFLEHKMFEREISPFEFYNKYGLDVNASTSDFHTGYYFIGSKGFYPSLKYLLNWIQSLKIDEKLVKKEQGIILEEANMYKDHPNSVLYKKTKSNVFINDPIKNEVIGTDKDIVSITAKQLKLCYETFYTPNNMNLLVVGNVDPKKVIETAKKEIGSFKNSNNKVERIYGNEPDVVRKKQQTIKLNVNMSQVSLIFKINKSLFKDLNLTDFELDMYLNSMIMMAIGPASDIRSKWLKEKLFTRAFYNIYSIDSHYAISFSASSENPDKLVKELKKYLNNIILKEEDLEREKKSWIATEIKKIDAPVAMMYQMLDDLIDYKDVITNKIDIIRGLNFDTLLKIKQKCDFSNSALIKIIPKK